MLRLDPFRIGSRGSKLAVAQAEWVAAELKKKASDLEISFVRITTTGDRDPASPRTLGGKGVFVKEIEEALLAKQIDLAVHSLKDLPQDLPPGLRLGSFPLRQDSRDAFISRFGEQLEELPRHSIIGTGSPRRQAQIRHRFKKRGYKLEPLRGNVDTRIKKLREGQFDAIVLALAGLRRLGLESEVTQILEPEVLLPAPGQGCLALEIREGEAELAALLEKIKDRPSDLTARAERAFLRGLGGNCLLPLGGLAKAEGETLRMSAIILDPEGEEAVSAKEEGPAEQPEYVGALLAERLLHDGGAEILVKADASFPRKRESRS